MRYIAAHVKRQPPAPPHAPELPFAAPDVAAEFARWLSYLGAERRMSPKTGEAYERDVAPVPRLPVRSISASA